MDQNLKIQLVRSIFQFKRLASTGFGMDLEKTKSDINMSELILLDGICDNTADSENNVAMSDIRGYLSVSKAAVSQMLGALEKKGYINRDIDKNNRRNLIVTLTPEGREVLMSQHEIFSGRLEKIISHLGESDVKQMIMIVNRMIEITNELDGKSMDEKE
jgi:DNA-binding MarR family transcriptional regulator